MTVIPWNRHAPFRRGPRDRYVVETAFYEAERLVALGRRRHGSRLCFVPLDETVLERAELEEVVVLFEPLDGSVMVPADVAREELRLVFVRLTSDAVPARIGAELDETVVIYALKELLDGNVVTGLGRADEIVVRNVEAPPRLGKPRRGTVGPVLRICPVLGGCPRNLVPVLVGPGEEKDVVARLAVPARSARRH